MNAEAPPIKAPPGVCSKCRAAPALKGQRWCGRCKAASKGARDLAKKLGDPNSTRLPYRPWPTGRPDQLPAWVDRFLASLAETGGKTLAASMAGVTRQDVRRLEKEDPAFFEATDAAIDYYADFLASILPNSAKPIGTIARLKSIRPADYESALIIQRSATLNLTIDDERTADEARQVLRQMLEGLAPSTRQKLDPALVLETTATVVTEGAG